MGIVEQEYSSHFINIGETGRTLEKRLSEHKNAVKNDTKNGIAVHSWTKQHQVDWEAAKTIEVEGNYWRRQSIRSPAHPPPTANIQLGLWVNHQFLLAACTEPTLTPLILLHSPHYNNPVTITALINYHFLISRHPCILTASDTPSYYLIESCMLSFVLAEEDLRIETSYEVTAVFLLNNPRYQ